MVIIHYENNRIFKEIIYGQAYHGIEAEMSAYVERFITILFEISKKNFRFTIIHFFISYSMFFKLFINHEHKLNFLSSNDLFINAQYFIQY